jgi:elongation factor 1 alpha-like protein
VSIADTSSAAAKKPLGKQTSTDLSKKTDALSLNDAPAQPAQPKIRSKGLDVSTLWEQEKAKRKPSAAFVVIGHVDHGKSTLMGRLLLDTGAVSQRDIDKYAKRLSRYALRLS